MVQFIKTCGQYSFKFNFGHIFSSIVLPFSAGEKLIFKTLALGRDGQFSSAWSGDDKNLGESFAWGYE